MIVGFTGTRYGMTPRQKETVRRLLEGFKPEKVRHGDCVGSDVDFAEICSSLDPRPQIVAHPGHSAKDGNNDLRGKSLSDETHPSQTHFARNRTIVDWSHVLIATPWQNSEQRTGGTWYTVDYARKTRKRTVIVWPDGTTGEITDG